MPPMVLLNAFKELKSKELQSKDIHAMESYGFKVHKQKQMHERGVIKPI